MSFRIGAVSCVNGWPISCGAHNRRPPTQARRGTAGGFPHGRGAVVIRPSHEHSLPGLCDDMAEPLSSAPARRCPGLSAGHGPGRRRQPPTSAHSPGFVSDQVPACGLGLPCSWRGGRPGGRARSEEARKRGDRDGRRCDQDGWEHYQQEAVRGVVCGDQREAGADQAGCADGAGEEEQPAGALGDPAGWRACQVDQPADDGKPAGAAAGQERSGGELGPRARVRLDPGVGRRTAGTA